MSDLWDRLMQWLAYRAPKALVFHCGVRMMAHASAVYDTTEIDALRPRHLLDAWERHYHSEERL